MNCNACGAPLEANICSYCKTKRLVEKAPNTIFQNAFNQSNQDVAYQINIAGDITTDGDFVRGNKYIINRRRNKESIIIGNISNSDGVAIGAGAKTIVINQRKNP